MVGFEEESPVFSPPFLFSFDLIYPFNYFFQMYSTLSLYVNLFLLFFLPWSLFGIGSKETERQINPDKKQC